MIIVNFKLNLYGKKAAKLANIIGKTKGNVIIAPAIADLALIAKNNSNVFSQHMDTVEDGAYTGHVSAKQLKEIGVKGTLINHAEMQVSTEKIKKCVELCRKHKLVSVVCANSLNKLKLIRMKCKPDYIAYEPPELIGGKISVTDAKPDVIKKAVKMAKGVKVLCGAGVHGRNDLNTALKLGTKGVLISSYVVLAKSPVKALKTLL